MAREGREIGRAGRCAMGSVSKRVAGLPGCVGLMATRKHRRRMSGLTPMLNRPHAKKPLTGGGLRRITSLVFHRTSPPFSLGFANYRGGTALPARLGEATAWIGRLGEATAWKGRPTTELRKSACFRHA